MLAVTDEGEVIVNLNDADMPPADLRRLRKHVGEPDVLLNQFSIAGYDGYLDAETVLRRDASRKLERMLEAHRVLGARRTIPFASFIYFSTIENRFINDFANSVADVRRVFDAAELETVVLAPGDDYPVGADWNDLPALQTLQRVFEATSSEAPFDAPPLIPLDQLEDAFARYHETLFKHYPAMLLRRIGAVRFHIADANQTVECDFATGTFRVVGDGCADAHIEVYSQPLLFALSTPFGFETLAVSGRLRVLDDRRRWRILKIVSMLHNQELYLKPPYLLDPKTLGYILERVKGNLIGQVLLRRRQRRGLR